MGAELATELELVRAGLYQAVDGYIKGDDVTQLAPMLKLKAGRLGRMFRDMRLTSIGGGADEVMLGIISKYMGTLPVPAKKKKPAAATTTAVEQGTATAHNP